jgi:nitrogenase iron protein NifH
MRMKKEVERICFLGKGGIGKSVIVCNISEALTQMGYRILQIGNDISLCSTLILRGEEEVSSVLASYRSQYDINLEDFIIESKSGVLLMELGSIEPGAGCLARGIHHIDELLSSQNIIEKYQIDYILYDIAGETPCTGYILPIRDGIMNKCIIVTTGDFSSLSTANNLLSGVSKCSKKAYDVGLIVNYADEFQAKSLLSDYAKGVNVPIVSFIDNSNTIKNSFLKTKTVYEAYPDSVMIKVFDNLAKELTCFEYKDKIIPFDQKELLHWQKEWKKRAYQYNNGIIDVDLSQNI